MWSPHRDLNSGPHSYQECALPLSYVGPRAFLGLEPDLRPILVQGVGFEPTKHKAADLQSAGFDRSPIPAQHFILTYRGYYPYIYDFTILVNELIAEATWSPRGDSNPPTCQLQIGCATIAPLGRRL